MADCTVYIDEAGDLGINRGTKWFVLTGVIVDKKDEPEIRTRMAAIKTRLNLHEIHLRKTSDFMKRAVIVRDLAEMPFTYMNVIVDTSKFDVSKIPDPLIAYNYVCKYMLQRASWFLRDDGKTADIMLSARGTSRDGELIEYIKTKLLPFPANGIDENLFENISAKTAATWDMLQLADVCATSTFLAYEVNGWGFCTPCYMSALSKHLYSRNGRIDTYGIKYFVNDMRPNMEELRALRVCTKKERIPGATTT